jgi:tripartite-type tricarboxylate transporter receptor subunit TctC
MNRREFLALGAALAAAPAAAEDSYPSRPIKLVVPFAAGGAVGAVARTLATPLSTALGQSIVIENRGGAGGILGMDAVAKAPPDGYTLLLIHSGITYMPGLYKTLPFDPLHDLDAIVPAVSGSYLLTVTNSVPVKNLAELIAYAKAHPGKLTYASAGIGSTLHLATEFLKRDAGIDLLHIPYKGAAQATTDLVGGQVQVMIGPVVSVLPLAQAGKIRALAVASLKRSPLAPELPTMAESGLPGFEVASWYGLAGPAGTPKIAIEELNIETNKALKSPQVIAQFRHQGYEPIGGTPQDLAARIKTDITAWTKIIRDAGIQPQ